MPPTDNPAHPRVQWLDGDQPAVLKSANALPPPTAGKASLFGRLPLLAYPLGYVYWLVALALFVYAYYPSHTLKLLVEHWEFNDKLSQLHFHPGQLKDWLTVCFDTPFKDFR